MLKFIQEFLEHNPFESVVNTSVSIDMYIDSYTSIEEFYPITIKDKFLDFNSGIGVGNIAYLLYFINKGTCYADIVKLLSNIYTIDSNPLVVDHNRFIITKIIEKQFPDEFHPGIINRIILKNFKSGDNLSFQGFPFKFNLVIGTFEDKSYGENSFVFLNSLLSMRKKGGLSGCFVPNNFNTSSEFVSFRNSIADNLFLSTDTIDKDVSFFSTINSKAIKNKISIDGVDFKFEKLSNYKKFIKNELWGRKWSNCENNLDISA